MADQQAGQEPKIKLLTTAEIQQKLEENSLLINAIQEQQNLGRLDECIKYQQVLQKNLIELGALADAQQQANNLG